MTKEERIQIFNETVNIVKNGKYITPNTHEEIIIHGENEMMEETVFYGKKAEVNFNELDKFNTNIEVINQDCLIAAQELTRKGKNVAVLNMASFQIPGGGVLKGSGAQEENIFRRTNLFKSLYQFHYVGDNFNVKQKEERYPLDYNFGAIYTPYVTVFRNTEDLNYQLLENPFTIGVITVPAVKNPTLKQDGTLQPWTITITKNKIKQILTIALQHKHTSIILSAFGCGAYKNPPTEIAKLFKQIIQEDNFKDKFENIIFAIIDDNNAYDTNKKGNLQPFKQTFET